MTALERPNNDKLSDSAPDSEVMLFEKPDPSVLHVRKNSGYFGLKPLEPERDSTPIKHNNLDASRFNDSESHVMHEDWLTENFENASPNRKGRKRNRSVQSNISRANSALSAVTRFTEQCDNEDEFVVHHFVSRAKK